MNNKICNQDMLPIACVDANKSEFKCSATSISYTGVVANNRQHDLGHSLCSVQQKIGHMPVTASRQRDNLILFSRDELVIIKLNPGFIGLLDPRHIMA